MKNKKEPKVTVIIPTYSRASYLCDAIDSVLNQSYDNIELIIVDDNGIGTRNQIETEEKIIKYLKNKKVRYIKHETNKNGASARNTGIKESTGDYISFLDDDDFYFRDRIKILVEDLEKNKDYDAVYSSSVIFEKSKLRSIGYAEKKGNLQLDILKQNSFFRTGSNMFFTTKSLKDINGFDEKFNRHQDLEVFVRFFEKYRIYAEPKILVAKCERDGMNIPDFDKAFLYRKQYLDVFKTIISNYDLNIQKDIYHENCIALLKKAKLSDNEENIEKVMQYIKNNNIGVTLKDRIDVFLANLESKTKIVDLYRFIRNKKYSSEDIEKCYEELKKYKNDK